MSQSLTLPDELFDRLRITADQRGVSIEQLIHAAIGALGPDDGSRLNGAEDRDPLLLATRALLDGTDPPITIDWDEVKQSLMDSEPAYGTVEEAMGELRQRPWAKEG